MIASIELRRVRHRLRAIVALPQMARLCSASNVFVPSGVLCDIEPNDLHRHLRRGRESITLLIATVESIAAGRAPSLMRDLIHPHQGSPEDFKDHCRRPVKQQDAVLVESVDSEQPLTARAI